MIVRIVLIVGIIIFVLFAAVQLNDPDPIVWVAAYLAAAAVAVPPLRGRHTILPLLLLPIYLIWFATLADAIGANWIEIEDAREAFGLLLCAIWMIVLGGLWWRWRRGRPISRRNHAGAHDRGSSTDPHTSG